MRYITCTEGAPESLQRGKNTHQEAEIGPINYIY
jgi:hypothetical protein